MRAVADTHAVIWYLFDDSRLSDSARSYIEQVTIAIAATALYLNVPVITRDRKIQASNLQTIW
jgi:PIN domain nuclease of toxin-antitoxin system